jgi:hypothetical protein
MKRIVIIASVLCLAVVSFVSAKSEYKDFMLTRYSIPGTSKLNSCDTCHSEIGGNWTRNVYGDQLETAGIDTTVPAMTSAFDTTDPMNADGDAALNWVELVNGTWPANASDFVPVGESTWGKIKALYN